MNLKLNFNPIDLTCSGFASASVAKRNMKQDTVLLREKWWAYLDLNQGPRPYQGRALTN